MLALWRAARRACCCDAPDGHRSAGPVQRAGTRALSRIKGRHRRQMQEQERRQLAAAGVACLASKYQRRGAGCCAKVHVGALSGWTCSAATLRCRHAPDERHTIEHGVIRITWRAAADRAVSSGAAGSTRTLVGLLVCLSHTAWQRPGPLCTDKAPVHKMGCSAAYSLPARRLVRAGGNGPRSPRRHLSCRHAAPFPGFSRAMRHT